MTLACLNENLLLERAHYSIIILRAQIGYILITKPGSLDNAIRKFILAKPS